jgi:hypothetical protein
MLNRLGKIIAQSPAGLLELLFFLPPILAVGAMILPEAQVYGWLISLPAAAVAGTAVSILLGIRRAVVLLPLAAAGGIAAAQMLTGWSLQAAVPFVSTAALIWRNGLHAHTEFAGRLTPSHFWTGILMYFIGFFLFRSLGLLQPFFPLLVWSGAAALILCVLLNSTLALTIVSQSPDGKPAIPAAIRRYNRIHVWTMLAAAFGVSYLFSAPLGAAVKNALVRLLRWIFSGSGEKEVIPPDVPQEPGELIPPELTENEPSRWMQMLLNALTAVAAVVSVVFLCWLMYWMYRQSDGLFRRLIDRIIRLLRRRIEIKEDTGYSDETTRLLTMETIRENWKKFLHWSGQWKKAKVRWEDLTGREKVRHVFRSLVETRIREGYRYQAHLTPAETVQEISQWSNDSENERETAAKLIRLYNQARYGERDIGLHDAESIRTYAEPRRKPRR